MAPEEFVTELKTRLLMDQYSEDTWCPLCDCVLDRRGRHAGLCAAGGDRVRKHNGARNRVGQFADAARMRPELEKPGLLQPCPDQPDANRRRPADVYVPSWSHGSPAAFDLAITSPHRQDIVLQASTKTGAAAEAYEQFKRLYLDTARDCMRQGIAFIPLIAETSGGWGPAAQCVFKALARSVSIVSGREPSQELLEHRQALSILISVANARAIFRRDPGSGIVAMAPDTAARLALEVYGGP